MSALAGAGREVLTRWPACQHADQQHEPHERRAALPAAATRGLRSTIRGTATAATPTSRPLAWPQATSPAGTPDSPAQLSGN